MQANPHLHFQGNCREAFNFYADTFGGKIAFAMTFGESPLAAQTPSEVRDQIIHTRLEFANQALFGCDAPKERYQKPQGFNGPALVPQLQEAQRIFEALASDGAVVMAFGPTFFAYRFGMCTDRFGIPWMVNCEKAP